MKPPKLVTFGCEFQGPSSLVETKICLGLEFLMYCQVQNFVHNLTVEFIWTVELDLFCVCSTVALPTRTPRSRWSSKDGQTKNI